MPVPSSGAAVPKVNADLVRKHLERTTEETRGAVRMRARTAAVHLGRPTKQALPFVAGSGLDASERRSDRAQSVDAGAALSGALLGEVPGDTGNFAHRTCTPRQRDDDTGTQRAAGTPKTFI